MSQPTEQTQIDVSLFAQADAETDPQPVRVDAEMMPARDMGADEMTTVVEPAPPPPQPVRQITVGVLPLWGIVLGWVLVIVAGSQAVKFVLKAVGLKDRLQRLVWRRWMYVVPIIVGTILSALFGPQLGKLFGLEFGLGASLVLLGPGSGATAAFAYDVLRSVVLPVIPATLHGVIERVTGIHLPDDVKAQAHLDQMDSEVEWVADTERERE